MQIAANSLYESLIRFKNITPDSQNVLQSECIQFEDNKAVITHNIVYGEITLPESFPITGAINREQLLSVLQNYGEKEITLESANNGNALLIKCGRSRTTLAAEPISSHYLTDFTPNPNEWKALPDTYRSAITRGYSIVNSDKGDKISASHTYPYLHFIDGRIEAISPQEMLKYECPIDLGDVPEVFINARLLAKITGVQSYQFNNHWFLLQGNDIWFAVAWRIESWIGNIDQYFTSEGTQIEWPANLVEEIPILKSTSQTGDVLFTLDGENCFVSTKNGQCTYSNDFPLQTPNPRKFILKWRLLNEILKQGAQCILTQNTIRIESNINLQYLVAIEPQN